MSGREDLVAGEGVDEGSADGTAEGAGSPTRPQDTSPGVDVAHDVSAASPGPQDADLPDQETTGSGDAPGGVLGAASTGSPADPGQAAAPDDVETAGTRQVKEREGTGQQYAVGEG